MEIAIAQDLGQGGRLTRRRKPLVKNRQPSTGCGPVRIIANGVPRVHRPLTDAANSFICFDSETFRRMGVSHEPGGAVGSEIRNAPGRPPKRPLCGKTP